MKKICKNCVNKTFVAVFFFLLFFAINTQTVVFAKGVQEETSTLARTLVSTEPSVKPEWVDTVPQSETEFFFVGTSQFFDTPANARDNAREDARIQVLVYYGQVIERQAVSLSTIAGSTRDTLAAYVVREDQIKTFAQNVVSEVSTVAYYTEMYLNSENKEEYIVYTLHQINRQKAESEIAGFAKNISQRYTASLSKWGTLRAALEGYAFIVKSLEQNPLHRIMAYIETSKGKAGLYEYARLQISELANSVSIEAIPARTIQETESLTTRIQLRSSMMPVTGLLDCQSSIFGMSGSDTISYPFKSASDAPYDLQIRNIKPGSYNVMVEILLSDLTGGIAKNTGGSFSLTVTPLNVLLDTPAAIEAGIKRAVDALAVELKTQTETKIGSFTMTGTDIPTGLSRYLTERVTHYAISNQARKFHITRETTGKENNQITTLSGFFTIRNNQADVTLELITPNGAVSGSQIFSISTIELAKLGISVEPENLPKIQELEQAIEALSSGDPENATTTPANQSINIQAFFNSQSMTYFHRDELKMTVVADRDCYFKIIHIDANNQMEMIYPNSSDTNNTLKANVPREIFETAKCYLYEPYGAEVILVVASLQKFANIEKEYITPWVLPATTANIRNAVRGERGKELESPITFSGEGEAKYTITVLKPHEEYSFGRPDDMRELLQSLQADVSKQGGIFVGNETSAWYIMGGVRGSYRVSRDAPDTIQFAYYNLDAYIANSNRGTRARGSTFNFSFARPQNIAQAVQTVRSSILEKGGTFTGNEQQGNFRAKGITGQYRVTDVVNVTITEKPLVVPNSVIEREVRSYFSRE